MQICSQIAQPFAGCDNVRKTLPIKAITHLRARAGHTPYFQMSIVLPPPAPAHSSPRRFGVTNFHPHGVSVVAELSQASRVLRIDISQKERQISAAAVFALVKRGISGLPSANVIECCPHNHLDQRSQP